MSDSATWFLTAFNIVFTFWGAHKIKIHLPFCVTSFVNHLENYSGDCWCFTVVLNKFLSLRRGISCHISSDILAYSLEFTPHWCQCCSLWVRRWISTDLSPVSAAAWPSQAAPGPGSPDPGLARLSEPRSGAHCACATRDTRNKNTGELETCTAGDYHMLAVIKTSSRNLWLADTGLTLDIRLSSLRFLHDLCSLYLVSSLWSTSAQSRSNIVRNKCSS